MLSFATTLMQMADARAEATIKAVAALSGRSGDGGGDANAKVLAELAALQARLDAEKKEREIAERHREELAKKDAEVAELRRKMERMEDEAERAEPMRLEPEPGASLWNQIGFGLANAVLAKPEVAAPLLAPLLERFVSPPSPPQAAPQAAPSAPQQHPFPPPRALHGEQANGPGQPPVRRVPVVPPHVVPVANPAPQNGVTEATPPPPAEVAAPVT